MAIKFLISGFEASGKSTLASKIEDSLVINFDMKEYTFPIPHINFKEYSGIDGVTETITKAIQDYQNKFGKLPKYVIGDTVTQLYTAMTGYNGIKYSGFDIHSMNNTETIKFNKYIETTLIANDISFIALAHTQPEEKSGRYIIPAQGQFAKAGSWLSIVQDSIFIDKSTGKLVVYQQSFKYPARTTLPDMKDKVLMSDYDINKHLDMLANQKNQALEFKL